MRNIKIKVEKKKMCELFCKVNTKTDFLNYDE